MARQFKEVPKFKSEAAARIFNVDPEVRSFRVEPEGHLVSGVPAGKIMKSGKIVGGYEMGHYGFVPKGSKKLKMM